MSEKRRSGAGAVFVLEDRGRNVGLHLVRRFQCRRGKKPGHAAALPREPSGGRKRQGTLLDEKSTEETWLGEQRPWLLLLLISGRWRRGVCFSARRCCRARMLFVVHVGVSGPVFALLPLHCPRHGSGVSAESRAPAGV